MKELKTILNEKSHVKKLNETLQNSGVIAFVTDTVWGVGCLPDNKSAVEKIYEIKGRDKSKPLILMSDKKENLLPYVQNISSKANELMDKYFPGALTVIMEKSDRTPLYCTSGKNTVGIRVPNNMFFQMLCSKIEGRVLATTSANLSNQPSSKTYEEALNSIGSYVDIIYKDYGCSCFGLESTVVLAINNDLKVLRQGCITPEYFLQ